LVRLVEVQRFRENGGGHPSATLTFDEYYAYDAFDRRIGTYQTTSRLTLYAWPAPRNLIHVV
jgi:hypothetical protein